MAQIIVGTDGLCTCNCADKCVCLNNNTGMGYRCTKQMLIDAGHHPVQLNDVEDDKAIREYICIDGKEKRITVKCVVKGV